MAKSALRSLFALVLVSQLATALQVTPNSPCSSVCQDSRDLDRSDPGSSTTKSSDITCEDADYSRAAGRKFKKCMSCLETSTFSQGSESDTMWFLYNLRYTAAYCVFGFPDASDFSPTPCTTETACGHLEVSMRHGIPSPDGTTAYSYCSAGDGNAMDPSRFESCIACTSALGTTNYLANFFAALSAGCQQKPSPGTLLGLNDTVFADGPIGIVDSETDDDDDDNAGLATPVIIGIAVGAVVFLLLIAGITFVCLRRRRNKRVRTSSQGEFRHRHRSSLSFQCQTHLASPRFWPSADEIVSTPMAENREVAQVQNRSSIWKPQHPEDGYASHHYYQGDTTFTATDSAPSINSRKASTLHITTTTTVPPTPPPQAYTPSSASPSVDYLRSPLSADTVTSTSALLPAFPPSSSTRSSSNSRFSIKPYVPAEHGVHTPAGPAAADVVISPLTAAAAGVGNGRTSPLWSSAWPLPSRGSGGSATIGGVPSLLGRRSPRVGSGGFVVDGASGSPVESLEIQTAFAAPPSR
ncbi:hypothetical protein P885DRAFT_34860 [Corynascus similis CBS 632.67]